MKYSEKEMIQLVLKNDTRAINYFVENYAPDVYGIILKYVRIHEDAEEICDDVFLTCLDKLMSFTSSSSLKTWIMRIAINKSLDFLRSKKSLRNGANYNTDEFNPEITNSEVVFQNHVNDAELSREQHFALYACIRNLGDRQRTAILLQLTNSYSNYDIAEVMGTSLKSVECLLRRARINLKVMLESGTNRLIADLARV